MSRPSMHMKGLLCMDQMCSVEGSCYADTRRARGFRSLARVPPTISYCDESSP
jgi:hypothetical protein